MYGVPVPPCHCDYLFCDYISHWDRYLGMMTAMTQVPVPVI